VRTLAHIILWLAVIGAIAVGVLRATCMRTWTMPSDDALLGLSVLPTIDPGDVLVLFRGGTPSFGELVLCSDPEVAGKYVVGRILGEPGDRVAVVDGGGILVNDKPIRSLRSCTPGQLSVRDPRTGDNFALACTIEEAGGDEYTRATAAHVEGQSQPFRVAVPESRVFLASDDRYYHDDSRDFGPVPVESCKERVIFRIVGARGWFDQPRRLSLIR
jgi:signal peptidase I